MQTKTDVLSLVQQDLKTVYQVVGINHYGFPMQIMWSVSIISQSVFRYLPLMISHIWLKRGCG